MQRVEVLVKAGQLPTTRLELLTVVSQLQAPSPKNSAEQFLRKPL